jgi:hypothetical protein
LKGIILDAAPAEVAVLEIAGRFGEPELIQTIVHPVARVEELHHRGAAVIRGVFIEVRRIIEYSKGRALRTRQVGHIIGIAIRVRVHVIASRFVYTIIDPAAGRSVGIERGPGHQQRGNQHRLKRTGRTQSRRKR